MLNVPVSWWTQVDIMVVDQVLRGRIHARTRVADVGCGSGRNIQPLSHASVPVWGCDIDPIAIEHCQQLAVNAGQSAEQFRVEALESTTLPAESFDFVMANAVLHFAQDQSHFHAMVDRFVSLLAPGGVAFARLATSDHWPCPGDLGGFSYVASIGELRDATERHGLALLDPLKTVVVEGSRTMTTWVMRRPD